MNESNNLTYCQRDRDIVLSKAEDYHKNNNERLKNMQKINIGTYQKKIRIKKVNMEKIDIIICLKKRNKNQKNTKKNIVRQKNEHNNE